MTGSPDDDLSHILDTAIAHHRAGRLDEAGAIYERVLAIQPDHADALNLSGALARERGELDLAAARIAGAILLRPRAPEYHANLAAVHLAAGRPADAAEHCRRALEADPGFAEAHYNLGNALFALGDAAAAAESFRAAADIDPENSAFATNYLFALTFASDDPAKIAAANRAWGRALEGRIGAPKPDFAVDRSPTRKLRLAYVLIEPATHPTLRFLEPVLRAHDRDAFDVTVYGDCAVGGPPSRRLVEAAGDWRDVSGLSAAELAAAIRADGIDVLAHPCTFKARYREVLAHRAAPVQIACTNLVSTTGLSAVDGLVTDARLDPPGETEAFYSERLIRLGHFNCYRSVAEEALVPASPPSAANGFVTFGSFNNVAKLTPECVAAWAAILAAVRGSRLLLKHRAYDVAPVRERVAGLFGTHGISSECLVFRGFTQDRAAYLGAYGDIDLALDPFPFGGGTTTYEAMGMGVPVVTLRGRTFMGRLGASAMVGAGAAEFVADDVASYVAAATEAARNPDGLKQWREVLPVRAAETLFNAERHTAELEAAYREMWESYCRDGA